MLLTVPAPPVLGHTENLAAGLQAPANTALIGEAAGGASSAAGEAPAAIGGAPAAAAGGAASTEGGSTPQGILITVDLYHRGC
ncbi:hypothetical protein BGX33_011751 [Mortierella sp. NVP41]|nr:hypothetical protein BGX33_011751 [Mortierella sp. NVP41]